MTPVEQELIRLIRHGGPVGVDRYMALCLKYYYGTRDPFGTQGDFTTAPEISQIFGELVGLWAAETWRLMGAPLRVRLVELGPGRGTLMDDALRAARVLPAFGAAISVHLAETSPVLRDIQAQVMATSGHKATWHDTVADALGAACANPVILIANEFLDALPIRQFQRRDRQWHERLVGLDDAGGLAFGLSAVAAAGIDGDAPEGTVIERAGVAASVVQDVARHVVAHGGAALFIDYGATESGTGDTLQAVKQHRYVDVFAEPGEADLTVQVDFAAVAKVAEAAGARVAGPVTQDGFLAALGIEQRAARLARDASPAQAVGIRAAVERFMDASPTGMGELFKVLAVVHPDLRALPGFPL